MSGRSLVKRGVESITCGLGVARLAESANRKAVAVLSYHNVVPEGESPVGDRSLHLPLAIFRRHLDLLERHYDVIPLEEADRPHDGRAPRVAITFDDAYAGAIVAGIAELARRNLPATVFVSSALLERRSFWWDRLADADGVVAPHERDHALWALAGDGEAVRRWMRDEGLREGPVPDYARSATRAELQAAVASGRVTLGGHGRDHLNLVALDEHRLAEELAAPAETLERDWPGYRPWVAYPYGLVSDAVEAAAASVYQLGFLIEGGLATRTAMGDRPRAIARINVPAGLSARGLRLRVSGCMP